ncbi:calcium-binding protein [Mesorhizobium sp. AaZ16]|uniref:calcium-binding protein n=1 Tax=Mesorhizobium sp. AaZ16 TaxID=3402289 RepID=UPI00374F78C1
MAATIDYDLVTLRSQFQANTFVTWKQWTPDVLGLSNGGYVVAYNNGPDFGWAMKLDFYGADGLLLAGAVTPNAGSTAAGGEPSLTELDNGNVLMIWDDNSSGNLGQQATIFSSTGQVVVSQFDITTSVNDFRPQVTTLAGGFVVSYMDTAGNLNFKVFDNDGAYQSGLADISGSLSVANPVIAALEDGGFVVAWTAVNNVVARIFEADGSPRAVKGSTDPFSVGAGGNNLQPAVAALPNGNFAVAYADTGWGGAELGSTGITLTVVSAGGSIVKPFVHVNTAGVSNEADPDIAVLENGFIVVTWTDPAGNNEILGRIFDHDGNPIGSPMPLSDSAGSDDIKSAVSAILAGQFITAWQDSESDGDGGRITALATEIVRTTTGDGADETLNGDALRDIIHGNGGNDTINGFGGNDTLNGGAGADTMAGGSGNDTYFVDSISDKVIEANGAGTGTDEVRISVSFSVVSQFVENMVLLGADSISAIGNNLANTITGNAGNNAIDGRGGIDVMEGGLGNDTYYVDNVLDKVVEANVVGTDTVYTSVSKAFVDQFVEVIRLSGSGNINTTGNGLANTIVGNGANNGINGREGADTLTGGYGNDSFVFNTALGATNIDTITDFKPVDDTIQLDDAIFASLGTGVLSANAFRSNATGLAQDADDRIIYNSANGQIYYDSNGNGAGGNVLVADLDSGLGVTNADFLVV